MGGRVLFKQVLEVDSGVMIMFTLTMLHEGCQEWVAPLWIAATDFKNAFDMVERKAIWTALAEERVAREYINALKRLYEGQTGTVVGNEESCVFGTTRGTKQGDPISPPLFNAVLKKAIAQLKATWIQKG